MSESESTEYLSLDELELVEDFGKAWKAPGDPAISRYLLKVPELRQRRLFRQLLQRELDCLRSNGEIPGVEEYRDRFTDYHEDVVEVFYREWPRLPEKFQPVRVLDSGGMGWILEARDIHAGRSVAIKIIKPAAAAHGMYRKRFLREALALANLEHENIVKVYEVSKDDGAPYFVMPLLKGESLKSRLKRTCPLPLAEVIRISLQLARGLKAAHDARKIHRDIKPENIWLDSTENDRVKILDFGLARDLEQSTDLTETRQVLGTPGWMAPEQAAGNKVEAAADLFSLGCMIDFMATGFHPLDHEDAAVADRRLARMLRLPPDLAKVVDRLVEKQPSSRPGIDIVLGCLERLDTTARESVQIFREGQPAIAGVGTQKAARDHEWVLSCTKTLRDDLAAMDLVKLCQFIDRGPIPEALLISTGRIAKGQNGEQLHHSSEFVQAIENLSSLALLHRDEKTKAVSLTTECRAFLAYIDECKLSDIDDSSIRHEEGIRPIDESLDLSSEEMRIIYHALAVLKVIRETPCENVDADHIWSQIEKLVSSAFVTVGISTDLLRKFCLAIFLDTPASMGHSLALTLGEWLSSLPDNDPLRFQIPDAFAFFKTSHSDEGVEKDLGIGKTPPPLGRRRLDRTHRADSEESQGSDDTKMQ